MDRIERRISRRLALTAFGLVMACALVAPQAASANGTPPNSAINPSVVPPDLGFKLNCTPGGGEISTIWTEWEQDAMGAPVLRFQFATDKKTTATVKYRPQGSNGAWQYGYKHYSPAFTTEHIFFTNPLAHNTTYDVIFTTYQCNAAVDTESAQYSVF